MLWSEGQGELRQGRLRCVPGCRTGVTFGTARVRTLAAILEGSFEVVTTRRFGFPGGHACRCVDVQDTICLLTGALAGLPLSCVAEVHEMGKYSALNMAMNIVKPLSEDQTTPVRQDDGWW